VLGQQNYWSHNRWRFTGALGAADLNLTLPTPDETGGESESDWQVEGAFAFAKLARKLGGNWYGGGQVRAIDAKQSFGEEQESDDFDVGSSVNAVGVGALVEYDSRDMPINSYAGRYFKLDVVFNYDALGSDSTYQNSSATFRAYHEVREDLVFAWDVQGCNRSGRAPLWDACTIPLRGFSATDYLGKVSASTQAELRWHFSPRWGAVGFAGAGFTARSLNERGEDDSIPSYGVGVRFMVLQAKRVNLRVDFAWSKDSDAVHVSVGEAF
jgi:outer membrane protein assembly factor BamA